MVLRSGKYFLRTSHPSLDSRANPSSSQFLKTYRRKKKKKTLWLLPIVLPQGDTPFLYEASLSSFLNLSIFWCFKLAAMSNAPGYPLLARLDIKHT